MKNFIIFFIVVIIVILGIFILKNKASVMQNKSLEKAVWEWNFPQDASQEKLSQEFKTLRQAGVTTIYLSLSDWVDYAEETDAQKREQKITASTEMIKQYVSAAKAQNISVHALFGNKKWSDPGERYLTDVAVNSVFAYNQAVPPEAHLSGLHFDIEPFSLPEFENDKTTGLQQYLETIDHITQGLKARLKDQPDQPNLTLAFDIPYWLDGKNNNLPTINWRGNNQYPLYPLIDLLAQYDKSEIVVMAYRNTTGGDNGSIALSKDEVAYATQKAPTVAVLIGMELNNEEPASITFYGKSLADVNKSATEIIKTFAGYSTFKGIAIHELTSYQKKLSEQ